MSSVRRAVPRRPQIAEISGVFRLRVESWQGAGIAESLQRLGLPVELYTPTQKSNQDEWPILAQRLANGTLALPPHARLREELLNLVCEVGPTGARVVDRGRVHQDHAVAVRGVCASLGTGGGQGWILGANLAPSATYAAVSPSNGNPDLDELRGYQLEQRAARRAEFERELRVLGDSPTTEPYGSGYGSRRW